VQHFAWERRRCLTAVVACLAMAWSGAFSRAEDTASAPAGLRVFYTGHSFHMFVAPRIEQLAKSAGIPGHKQAGVQGLGGSRVIQHWELADDKNKAKPALAGGEVDVFTMAAHLAIPDAGIEHFTELGLKHNPKLRLLVQASWMPFDHTAPELRIRDNAQRDAMKVEDVQAATDEWRKKMEAQVDDLNKRHAVEAVFIVPVGDAVNELRRRIVAGMFPGVAKQSELFRDSIGHGLGHVQALAAYCNFAAIYRQSPEGLKLNEPGVTDEQHAILQKIAWDTVAGYSHSGVKKP
jgi:hypothetical protein